MYSMSSIAFSHDIPGFHDSLLGSIGIFNSY
jgi:hypothetical protein